MEVSLIEIGKILERVGLGVEMKSLVWGILGLRYLLDVREELFIR